MFEDNQVFPDETHDDGGITQRTIRGRSLGDEELHLQNVH